MNIDELHRKWFENLPVHLQALGLIVRETVETGELRPLGEFLRDIVDVDIDQLGVFRDLLILYRLDLKDLEPAARARLRARRLATQTELLKTIDYQQGEAAGADMRCRDCKYFVTAPLDGGPNGDKPCVALGTKGVDVACFGFTRA